MAERDDAARQVEQRRGRIAQLAGEVSRRLTPEYAKGRAREMARERMDQMKESAIQSSWVPAAIGAGIGALVAKALQSRAQARDHRFERERFGYGEGFRASPAGRYDGRPGVHGPYREEEPASAAEELKERAGERIEELEEGAGELGGRLSARAGQLKDRMSEQVSSFRERLPDRERIRASTREDTGLWALGALGLGLLFGYAIPATQKEQQLIEPARRKARELGELAKGVAAEKGGQALDKASERLQQSSGPGQPQPQGGTEPPALH